MSDPDTSLSKEAPQGASPVPTIRTEAQRPSPQSEFSRRAILALAGAFSVTFCSVGFINAFGVFQEYYAQTILSDKSPSTISWIGSFNMFCLFGGMMVAGMLEYKFGPTVVMCTGSMTTIFALFMTSLCKQFYEFFLAQGFLLGVGICLVLMPAFVNVTYHFRASRGVAMGIIVAGSSLGGVIWPIALHRLLGEVGFGWAVRTAAFIMIPLLGLAIFAVRRPEGFILSSRGKPDLSFLKNPAIIFLSIGMFFVYLGLFSPFFYITSWTISLGLDATLAFYMISIMNASSLFGRIVPGIVADRVGPFNVMIVIVAISGVIATCWTKATTIPSIVVFSLAYGFTSGGVMSLQGPCAAAPVTPPQYGVAMGSVMTVLSIAALIGTPISGQLLDVFGYRGISLFSGFSMLLGAAFTMIARLFRARGLIAKTCSPMTTALGKLATQQASEVTVSLNVDGPYGVAGVDQLQHFDRVLLVAGGVGATFILPLYRHIRTANPSAAVRLVWAIRSTSELAWGSEDGPDIYKDENIRLFVTRYEQGESDGEEKISCTEPVSSKEFDDLTLDLREKDGAKDIMESTAMEHHERPDLQRIVDEVLQESPTDRVAVVVCGPAAMVCDLRDAVGFWIQMGRDVYFKNETFSL